jgi:hypothetical protein
MIDIASLRQPRPLTLVPAVFVLASLILSACSLLGEPDSGPVLQGYFGNRLEGLPPESLLDSSLKAFRIMQDRSGNSYQYRVQSYGIPGGKPSHTDITVRAGIPERLEFHGVSGDSRKDTTFSETGAALENEPGYASLILDSAYSECGEILRAGDPAHGMAGFSYDGNYILRECGYTDDRMADGHPSVTRIVLKWGSP